MRFTHINKLLLGTACVVLAAAQGSGAHGATGVADYPSKPIRMIVPSAPGSGTDIVGRMIGEGLNEIWKRPIVVDNRGGAGGIPAVKILAKDAANDGYTMMLGSSGHFSFATVLYSKLPYDPQKDLTPLSIVASQPFVVVVHPTVPAATIKEFIDYAKSRPDALNYGSGGAGTATHLGTELLMLMGGFKMQHVAYRGSAPAMAALLSGEIQLQIPGLAQAMPLMKSGRIKVLALTGAKRSRAAPNIPTVAESGIPGFEFEVWYGLMFPGNMPRDILMKANEGVSRAVKFPAVNQRFTTLGMEPVSNSPDEFAEMIRQERPKWERVVKAANIRIQ